MISKLYLSMKSDFCTILLNLLEKYCQELKSTGRKRTRLSFFQKPTKTVKMKDRALISHCDDIHKSAKPGEKSHLPSPHGMVHGPGSGASVQVVGLAQCGGRLE